MLTRFAIAGLLAAVVLRIVVVAQAPSGLPGGPQGLKAEPARFTDPERRQKLTSAFADIDGLAREYAEGEQPRPAAGPKACPDR